MQTYTNGQRVKYSGMFGETNGLTGRVIRQYKSGVLVRWSYLRHAHVDVWIRIHVGRRFPTWPHGTTRTASGVFSLVDDLPPAIRKGFESP